MLQYQQTAVSEISLAGLDRHGIRLLIKREDLNHPFVSGNKWWKLKYNLQEALRLNHDTILTYGGAFSNHIYATAAAARELNLKCIGIIRGEVTVPLNPTLRFAKECGMQLHYMSRSAYREINSTPHLKWVEETFGNCYRIPEGGTNEFAVRGCEEFGKVIDQIECDVVCLPVGTGGTISGVIRGVSSAKKILGFAALNDAAFLRKEIAKLSESLNHNWELLTEYSYGGYAKRNPQVSSFIESFFESTNIPLDFVYTGKMLCGVFDLIEKRYFKDAATILIIHTGGLQGHS